MEPGRAPWAGRRADPGTLGLSRRALPAGRRREPRPVRAPIGAAPRLAAASALGAIVRDGLTLDAAAERHLAAEALSERDRPLARRILLTSLRRHRQIAAVLEAFMTTAIDARSGRIADILVTGAAQILFLRTPAHAVVNIAAHLAAGAPSGAALKGLVNAVLRRIADAGEAVVAAQDAERLAVPDWLWHRWSTAHGEEVARAAGRQMLAEPPLDLTVKADASGWAGRLGGQLLPSGTVRLAAAGPVPALAGYAEGAWWVQDVAAALPARLLRPGPGETVIDLCAAPGGKTAQLAQAGARVIALDREPARMARLRANLARLALPAETVVADALTWRAPRPADAVLVDAPCTATGVMRRRPDIALRRRPEHLIPQARTQARLIEAAIAMTRPGGRIVYCACSLEPEEGEDRYAALLAGGAPVAPMPIRAEEVAGFAEAVRPDGTLRILPTHLAAAGGADGFFVFRVSRT